MKKNSWKDYFSFTAKERNAVIILLLVMGAFIALPFFLTQKEEPLSPNEKLQQQIVLLEQNDSSESIDNAGENSASENVTQSFSSLNSIKKKDSLFYFDPNTVNENGMNALGLTDRNIHTIVNYRNKGGRFYKPEDLEKIYGLNKEKAAELIPFIKIENQNKTYTPQKFSKTDSVYAVKKMYQPKTPGIININTATPADFKNLPGIGDILSNRIVKFRDKIGGFKSVDDIKKTYGLSDSVFQNIRRYLTL